MKGLKQTKKNTFDVYSPLIKNLHTFSKMINQLLCTVHSLHCSVAESLHHAIFSYHANKATTEMMCHARQYAGSLTDHVVLHLQVAVMAGDPFILPTVIIIATRLELVCGNRERSEKRRKRI